MFPSDDIIFTCLEVGVKYYLYQLSRLAVSSRLLPPPPLLPG